MLDQIIDTLLRLGLRLAGVGSVVSLVKFEAAMFLPIEYYW
jgi:hypothetical protein